MTTSRTLRDRLVDRLVAERAVTSAEVEAVLREVPRELFLPGVPLELVYADDVVVTKRDEDGRALSSASAPGLVADMLRMTRARPGQRILEIGTATGVNACYLSRLVGPEGRVYTVEIDPDFAEGAGRGLAAAGADNVVTVLGDGEYGVPEAAPFDAVEVTAQAGDIAAAWLDQLNPASGRLVVPLTLRGLSRTFAFRPEGDHWVADEQLPSGFVPIRGEGARAQRGIALLGGDEAAELRVDDDQPADAQALRAAFAAPAHQEWTGVTLPAHDRSLLHLDFWLAASLERYGRFVNVGPSVGAGPGPLGWTLPFGTSATWDRDTVAYVTLRQNGLTDFELGVWAHGPRRAAMAADLAAQVRHWDRRRRGGPEPVVRAYRAGTPDHRLAPGRVVDRPHTRMVIG
ncbi:methyltransferase, FxLD system [Streptacidiphilus carbonis]|uniref:methyltransferase, FxLD system n=1 Tax=Streptacidiphilus carbonis TaxID=105422 RepID=UPI000694E91F|nr:methyltransferase, FxLD system [Streptacidiphilus carbonis]